MPKKKNRFAPLSKAQEKSVQNFVELGKKFIPKNKFEFSLISTPNEELPPNVKFKLNYYSYYWNEYKSKELPNPQLSQSKRKNEDYAQRFLGIKDKKKYKKGINKTGFVNIAPEITGFEDLKQVAKDANGTLNKKDIGIAREKIFQKLEKQVGKETILDYKETKTKFEYKITIDKNGKATDTKVTKIKIGVLIYKENEEGNTIGKFKWISQDV